MERWGFSMWHIHSSRTRMFATMSQHPLLSDTWDAGVYQGKGWTGWTWLSPPPAPGWCSEEDSGHLPSAKTKWKHSGAGSMRRSRMAPSRCQARENRCFSFWGRLLLAGPWLRATLLSHTHAGLLAAEQQQSHHCEAFCPLAAQRGGPAGCRDKRPLNIASLAVLGKGSERMLPDVRRFLRFSAAPHQPHPTINTALNDRLAS